MKEITIKKIATLFLVFLITISLFGNVVQAKDIMIKDVQNTDDAYPKIQWVIDQGYMGLSLMKFMPDSNIRRSEFAIILSKINGDIKKLDNPKVPFFLDVKVNSQYYRYIETEKDNITYFSNSKGKLFMPQTCITREETCMSIVRVLGYDSVDALSQNVNSEIPLFSMVEDADKVSSVLSKYVTLAVQNQLIDLRIDGYNSYVDPKKSITRKQLALFIYNAIQNKEPYESDASTTVVIPDNANISSKVNAVDSTPEPAANKSNYMEITLNGRKRTYFANANCILNRDSMWTFEFISNKYSNKDLFQFYLPKDIASGDTITGDSNIDHITLFYRDENGVGYALGISDFDAYLDNWTLYVNKFGGNGDFIEGTIEGILSTWAYSGDITDTITFKDGKFKIKIEN